jgi:hypothetical protein
VRVYVAWVPKRGAQEKDVREATATVPDARAKHFWDGSGTLLKSFRPPLGLKGDAWDVYVIYRPGVRWEGAVPPKPTYWTHQLTEVWDKVPHLDPTELRRQLTATIGGTKGPQ